MGATPIFNEVAKAAGLELDEDGGLATLSVAAAADEADGEPEPADAEPTAAAKQE